MSIVEGSVGMDGRIFVEIAAYRDLELAGTIESILTQAEHPELITFGIVHQYGAETINMLNKYKNDGRFKIIEMEWHEARGVGETRALIETLYDGEEWVLQIDAHMLFGKGWDTTMKKQWRRCGDARAVLSTYPAIYKYEKENEDIDATTDKDKRKKTRKKMLDFAEVITSAKILDEFMGPGYRIELVPTGRLTVFDTRRVSVAKELRGALKRTLYVTEGLEFFRGDLLKNVRYVKEVAFGGEEIVRSVQMYTHGYNIYIPVGLEVYHNYVRTGAHRYWSDMAKNEETLKIYDRFMKKSDMVRDAILAGEHTGYLGKERSVKTFMELVQDEIEENEVAKKK